MAKVKLEETWKERCFGGYHKGYSHESTELKCKMQISVYEPEAKTRGEKFDVLFFLSGASCNEQNFIMKFCPQRFARDHRFILVGPDTSPRHVDIPGDNDHWLLGKSASWYLDALVEPWSKHYRMYSYITKELPELIKNNFNTTEKIGICGHSMGGSGAIIAGLRNPDVFSSISAFAPTSNPSASSPSEPAYTALLGSHNRYQWHNYDSYELIKRYDGPYRDILVDQGTDDEYLKDYLKTQCLTKGMEENPNKGMSIDVNLRMHKDYTHSHFCVQTFIEDHFRHHKRYINNFGC